MWSLKLSSSFRGVSPSEAQADERGRRGRTAGMTMKLLVVCGLAGLTAGCFQPMYAEKTIVGGTVAPGIKDQMNAVEVPDIKAPSGSRLARISSEVRNNLIYDLTGGSGGAPPLYRLTVNLAAGQQQVIVDITSGRPDIQNYALDAYYTLTELSTGKTVLTAQTFARVSYNIPGQMQRFAGDRGMRDAENRAARVVSENIRNRLASYFTAGT